MVVKTQSVADADTPNVDLSAMPEDEREHHVRKMLEDYCNNRESSQKLFKFILGRTQDYAHAEDILQNVYIKAFRFAKRYVVDVNFNAWLHRIAVNEIINASRQRINRHEMVGYNDGTVVAMQERAQPVAPDQEVVVACREYAVALETALAKINPEFAKIFRLAGLEGHEYKEIAEILGVQLGTVMSRLFRARKALQNVLPFDFLGHTRTPEPLELE